MTWCDFWWQSAKKRLLRIWFTTREADSAEETVFPEFTLQVFLSSERVSQMFGRGWVPEQRRGCWFFPLQDFKEEAVRDPFENAKPVWKCAIFKNWKNFKMSEQKYFLTTAHREIQCFPESMTIWQICANGGGCSPVSSPRENNRNPSGIEKEQIKDEACLAVGRRWESKSWSKKARDNLMFQ